MLPLNKLEFSKDNIVLIIFDLWSKYSAFFCVAISIPKTTYNISLKLPKTILPIKEQEYRQSFAKSYPQQEDNA